MHSSWIVIQKMEVRKNDKKYDIAIKRNHKKISTGRKSRQREKRWESITSILNSWISCLNQILVFTWKYKMWHERL